MGGGISSEQLESSLQVVRAENKAAIDELRQDAAKRMGASERLASERLASERLASERRASELVAVNYRSQQAMANRLESSDQRTRELVAAVNTKSQQEMAKRLEAGERLANERLASERLASDQRTCQLVAANDISQKKMASQLKASERLASERLASERLASERLASERLASDQRLEASDQRTRELVAANDISQKEMASRLEASDQQASELVTENDELKQDKAKREELEANNRSKQDEVKRELSERINSGYTLNGIPLIDFEDLELDKDSLGEGTFGVVYKGNYTKTQSENIAVAVKIMKDTTSHTQPLDDKQYTALLLECKGMIQVSDHRNVVNIYGYSLNIYFSSESSFDAKFDVYLVMESCDESLWEFIHRASLDNKDFHGIADQIAQGMTYVAEQGIIHRDLRSANILMKESGKVIKIGDFGLSRNMKQSLSPATVYYRGNSKSQFPSFWAAPESLWEFIWTEKSDVWSYGVVMIELYSAGIIPSHAEPAVRRKGLMPFERPRFCPDTIYKDLIVKCWEFEPKNRPTFREISAIVAELHAQF